MGRSDTVATLVSGGSPEVAEPGESSGVRVRTGPSVVETALATSSRVLAQRFVLAHGRTPEDAPGVLFHSAMKGRVLDTALTLHVLQKSGVDADWQARLRAFLRARLASADLFSATVARSVLAPSAALHEREEDPAWSSGLNRLLSGMRHARKRKRALLSAILAEVSAVPFDAADFDPELVSDEAVHLFSHIYFAALRIIHGRHNPSGGDASSEIAFLANTQSDDGSWERQSLLTLVALIALGRDHPSFDRGLGFLRSLTREDGGVAFCDDLNLWTTALAGIALLACDDVPRETLHGVAEYILYHQQDGGGWAFTERVAQTDTDTTAHCTQFLLQLDEERYAEPIARAHRHLRALQRADGGYPTWDVAGDSEATMTANIALIQALGAGRHPELRPRILDALDFLCAHQSPDGTFERSWSLSEGYSIFRAGFAFAACRGLGSRAPIEEAQRRSVAYLATAQHPDGGWGQTVSSPSDALSTAYALLTLTRQEHRIAEASIASGLRYLVSQQDMTTGEIPSVPDVVGPRPFVFDIPLLSTVFSLLSLRATERWSLERDG